jgi:DNA topoisomerase IB
MILGFVETAQSWACMGLAESFSATVLLAILRPLYRLVCQRILTETGPTLYNTCTRHGGALAPTLTERARRRMKDRVLPSEKIAKALVELLDDTLLAADACELGRLEAVSEPPSQAVETNQGTAQLE